MLTGSKSDWLGVFKHMAFIFIVAHEGTSVTIIIFMIYDSLGLE